MSRAAKCTRCGKKCAARPCSAMHTHHSVCCTTLELCCTTTENLLSSQSFDGHAYKEGQAVGCLGLSDGNEFLQ